MSKQLRQKLIGLLDDPQVAAGFEAVVRHLERYIDDRIAEKERGPRPPRPERPDRRERHEARGKPENPDPTPPRTPRDAGIPKDLAFKPFNALAPEPENKSETPAQNSPTPSGGS